MRAFAMRQRHQLCSLLNGEREGICLINQRTFVPGGVSAGRVAGGEIGRDGVFFR